MGKWDFACMECDEGFPATTKKEADKKAKDHTKQTGHADYHTAVLGQNKES